ncbi:MAG: CvpA family protein [Clostridia bacterium]|nr:CvpA family protein [Clostridia bacterium]
MIYDICIISVVALFAFLGVKQGLINSVYSLLSIVVSLIAVYFAKDSFVSAVSKSPAGDMIRNSITANYDSAVAENCTDAIVFFAASVILYIIIRLILKMTKGVFGVISSLPIIKPVNKVSGLILGITIGAVFSIFVTNILHTVPQTRELVESSSVVEYFKSFLII